MKRREFLAGLGAGTLAAAGFDFLGKDARQEEYEMEENEN